MKTEAQGVYLSFFGGRLDHCNYRLMISLGQATPQPITIDTGITGIVVGHDAIGKFTPLPANIQRKLPSPRSIDGGNEYVGMWVITDIELTGAINEVLTIKNVPVFRCHPIENSQGPSILGIGFNPADILGSAFNPLLNVGNHNGKGYLPAGYWLSQRGLRIGVSKADFPEYQQVQLKKNPRETIQISERHVADWLRPSAKVQLTQLQNESGAASIKMVAPFVLDTSSREMMIVPGSENEQKDNYQNNGQFKEQIKVRLYLEQQERCIFDYEFVTQEQDFHGKTGDATPQDVNWGTTRRSDCTMVSPGRFFINRWDYFFDAEAGVLGFHDRYANGLLSAKSKAKATA